MNPHVIITVHLDPSENPAFKLNGREILIKDKRHSFSSLASSDLLVDCHPKEAFERVLPFVSHAKDGYDVCVFAYGGERSGQNFTMFGNGEISGVVQLSIDHVFAAAPSIPMQIRSVLISEETAVDLLKSGGPAEVSIGEEAGSCLEDLTEVAVSTENECKSILSAAAASRLSRGKQSGHFLFSLKLALPAANVPGDRRNSNLTFFLLAASNSETKSAAIQTLQRFLTKRDETVARKSALTRALRNPLASSCYACFLFSISSRRDQTEATIETLSAMKQVKRLHFANREDKANEDSEIKRDTLFPPLSGTRAFSVTNSTPSRSSNASSPQKTNPSIFGKRAKQTRSLRGEEELTMQSAKVQKSSSAGYTEELSAAIQERLQKFEEERKAAMRKLELRIQKEMEDRDAFSLKIRRRPAIEPRPLRPKPTERMRKLI